MKFQWKQSFTFVIIALVLLVAVFGCAEQTSGTTATTTSAPDKTIIFADAGWDSIQVHNRIAAFILEHGYGYKSDYVPGETIPLFAGLAKGDIDINMECWVENQQEAYDKAVAANEVIDLGSNFADNWQGFLVPTYMIKGDASRNIKATAPDLKSVSDLPEYWELFKDPENPSKGRFYSCIAGWECEKINETKFKAYGLDKNFAIFLPGSGAALAASMVSAYEKGAAWFGYYWAPTWILGKLDMTPIEEPAYDKKIWETTHACAYPAVNVNIIVNKKFADANPMVTEFLSKYETTTDMANKALAYMQAQKADTGTAAKWFLKEDESTWTPWVASDIAAKIKKALQ
ncbi:MAG TPA: ABC transporter substrate-binding protein [Dehalococcoidia bacterium]|nr:ABC transporter substrate-binding protein [Dehalococcoidia bacterium]